MFKTILQKIKGGEEKEGDEEMSDRYFSKKKQRYFYKTLSSVRRQSNARDVILLDPYKGYYIKSPYKRKRSNWW
jgi:hypothetical protein